MKFIPLHACLLIAFTAGCANDEQPIRKYKVEIVGGPPPMGKFVEKPPEPKAEGAPTRYLTAIIPVENKRSWFFKLTGDPAKLEPHAKDFRAFMESINFPKDGSKPVAWKLPTGWTEGKGNDIRYTTLILPSEPKPLELTVSLLPGELEANINRWRGELGLRNIVMANETEFNENVKTIKTDGRTAYLMDMTGKRDAGASMPKFPDAKGGP